MTLTGEWKMYAVSLLQYRCLEGVRFAFLLHSHTMAKKSTAEKRESYPFKSHNRKGPSPVVGEAGQDHESCVTSSWSGLITQIQALLSVPRSFHWNRGEEMMHYKYHIRHAWLGITHILEDLLRESIRSLTKLPLQSQMTVSCSLHWLLCFG